MRACGRATACDRKRVENAQGRQLQTHVRTTSDVSTTTTIPPTPFLAEFTDLSASQHMRRWYTSESCPAPRSRPCSVPILDSVFSSPPSTQGGSHRKRCAFSSRIIPPPSISASRRLDSNTDNRSTACGRVGSRGPLGASPNQCRSNEMTAAPSAAAV